MQEAAPANLTSECPSVDKEHSEPSVTKLSDPGNTPQSGGPTAALKLSPIVPETFQRYTRGRTMYVDSTHVFNAIADVDLVQIDSLITPCPHSPDLSRGISFWPERKCTFEKNHP